MRYSWLILTAMLAFVVGTPASAVDPAEACRAIGGKTINAVVEGPDCVVEALASPTIRFAMRLPLTGWNGRLAHIDGFFAHLGCTGAECGGPVSTRGCDRMVQRGYACMVSGMADHSNADSQSWARRGADGRADFAHGGAHLATVAAKAMVARFYGKPPDRSYFLGCSIGGRQGLVEAQRYPHDYDGIIAGAPATRYLANRAALLRNAAALLDAKGRTLFPAPDGVGYLQPDFRLLHKAILARCDRVDGVADGILADPTRCRFDPAELACAAVKQPTCLSADQVAAIRRIFAGTGGLRAMPGSEVNWGYSYMAPDGGSAVADRLAADIAAGSPAPAGAALAGQVAAGDALYAADDPDLTAFARAGGRLIVFQGWSDHEVLPQAAIAYREAVVRNMGAEAADRVMRLFMIPAMDHCGNGASADKIDYVGAIEAWVEQGRAPDLLIAARVKDVRLWPGDPGYWGSPAWDPARIEFARPVYPYPATAIHAGKGDDRDPASFVKRP